MAWPTHGGAVWSVQQEFNGLCSECGSYESAHVLAKPPKLSRSPKGLNAIELRSQFQTALRRQTQEVFPSGRGHHQKAALRL